MFLAEGPPVWLFVAFYLSELSSGTAKQDNEKTKKITHPKGRVTPPKRTIFRKSP